MTADDVSTSYHQASWWASAHRLEARPVPFDVLDGDRGWESTDAAVERARGVLRAQRASGKCQFVFPAQAALTTRGDHSRQVAELAAAIARRMPGMSPRIVYLIALLHDCGHGPGGHAFERAVAPIAPGWDHATRGAELVLSHGFSEVIAHEVGSHPWEAGDPATWEGELVSWVDRVSYLTQDWLDALCLGIVERSLASEVLASVQARSFAEFRIRVLDDLLDSWGRFRVVGVAPAVAQRVDRLYLASLGELYGGAAGASMASSARACLDRLLAPRGGAEPNLGRALEAVRQLTDAELIETARDEQLGTRSGVTA